MGEPKLEITRNQCPPGWDDLIAGLPNTHILQSSLWANIKASAGWKADYLIWKQDSGKVVAACLVLKKGIPILSGMTGTIVLYAPRGPLLDWNDNNLQRAVISDLQAFTRKNKGIYLKIDPDLKIGDGLPGSSDFLPDPTGKAVENTLLDGHWRFSGEQVQFRNTVLIDLQLTQTDLLARMKQKTRYNISLAERKGITIRRGTNDDLAMLYHMYAVTAARDGFAIRDEAYYLNVWASLMKSGNAIPLIAYCENTPVSGIVMFIFAERAYYFYGMSSGEHRDKMPNHLLQWSGMQIARDLGCRSYDMWGAPDAENPADPMWGVYRFKEGFNGNTVAGIGAWDYVANLPLFIIYSKVVPLVLGMLRSIGRRRVLQEVQQ